MIFEGSLGKGKEIVDVSGVLDEDSLKALEIVIRQATQLLEAARPKKRRKTGGH